ncbi:GNAT family N-acetyltransferase [Paenibacillus tritici]|uniref:GNAT family N-acetyltransferase n=1 Tax=Paenibacillus tritici TaxID=1873425 RepID=A0ABX2DJY0_9BACL|nr:GNAT family N-acetyltransferase [Paenibacillus tritici]NQX44887.1 GNAT family N-acetyltransferase [Paenibacillus tritici]
MFVSFGPDDSVLHSKAFMQEEAEYNLIHLIAGNKEALRIKTPEDDLIFAHAAGFNPWLWISAEMDAGKRNSLVQQLLENLPDREFPGVTGTPETGRLFAEAYSRRTGKQARVHMLMEAYHCPQVQHPHNVSGRLVQADESYIPVIAEYLARFVEDVFGTESAPENFLGHAKEVTDSGKLRLWIDQGRAVSMANLAHQSFRHGRINEVFTLHEFRKQGYASAVVAELCAELLNSGLTPMLYADAANPDSNKVYQSIGFKRTGSIADLRFQ